MRLSREGRRSQSALCWVRYVEPLDLDLDEADTVACVGYAIGRSVGSAVVRNRIRRRLRAVVEEIGADLTPGLYLLGARSDRAATVVFDELRTDVRSMLDRAASRASRYRSNNPAGPRGHV